MSNDAGIGRLLAPFEHVEPPRIVGEVDAHVVGHEVEDQADAGLAQRRGEPGETGLAAEFGIERLWSTMS